MLETLIRHHKVIIYLTGAFMVSLLVADVLIPTGYGRFPWEGVPGFAALLGAGSALIAVLFFPLLGRLLRSRSTEDGHDD